MSKELEAPSPQYIEHIQFEGRDCVVLSPEDYEALYEAALRSPSREEIVAECMDAAHDAIHMGIEEMVECERVKALVNDALASLKNRTTNAPSDGTKVLHGQVESPSVSNLPSSGGSTQPDDKPQGAKCRHPYCDCAIGLEICPLDPAAMNARRT